MSDGSSASTQKATDHHNQTATINDVQETVSVFESKVANAQLQGQEWVETDPDVIKFYNPHGLGGAKFFSYKGVFVCEKGKLQECLDIVNDNLARRIHGQGEGIVL